MLPVGGVSGFLAERAGISRGVPKSRQLMFANVCLDLLWSAFHSYPSCAGEAFPLPLPSLPVCAYVINVFLLVQVQQNQPELEV